MSDPNQPSPGEPRPAPGGRQERTTTRIPPPTAAQAPPTAPTSPSQSWSPPPGQPPPAGYGAPGSSDPSVPSYPPAGAPPTPRRSGNETRWVIAFAGIVVIIVLLGTLIVLVLRGDRSITSASSGAPGSSTAPGSTAPVLINPTRFALAGAATDLASDLQRESIYSARYMASNKKEGKGKLEEQRSKTDSSRTQFDQAAKNAKKGQDLELAVKAVQSRLQGLQVNRVTVDIVQTDPPNTVDQYQSAWDALYDVDDAIGREIDDATELRRYQSLVELQRVASARATEGSLLAIIAQVKLFPGTWNFEREASPCETRLTFCPIFQKLKQASEDGARAEKTFDDEATPEQREIKRNALPSDQFDDLTSRIVDAGNADGGTSKPLDDVLRFCGADCSDVFVRAAVEQVDALATAQKQLLETLPR